MQLDHRVKLEEKKDVECDHMNLGVNPPESGDKRLREGRHQVDIQTHTISYFATGNSDYARKRMIFLTYASSLWTNVKRERSLIICSLP